MNFTPWERCITRGVPGGIFPAGYGSGTRSCRVPGYVAIVYEMIHEARIIPLDGRPHLGPSFRLWNGDSSGHWEGNTLVVDITSYNDKGSVATNVATPACSSDPAERGAARRRALYARRREHDRLRGGDRGPQGLHGSLESSDAPEQRAGLPDLRVRVSRGEPATSEHAQRGTRARQGRDAVAKTQ